MCNLWEKIPFQVSELVSKRKGTLSAALDVRVRLRFSNLFHLHYDGAIPIEIKIISRLNMYSTTLKGSYQENK